MESGCSNTKKKHGNVRRKSTHINRYSQQRHGPEREPTRKAPCTRDMEQRVFRGGPHSWRLLTMLGRCACLRPRPGSFGAQRGEGLGHEGKGAGRMTTTVDKDGFGGEGCGMMMRGGPGVAAIVVWRTEDVTWSKVLVSEVWVRYLLHDARYNGI